MVTEENSTVKMSYIIERLHFCQIDNYHHSQYPTVPGDVTEEEDDHNTDEHQGKVGLLFPSFPSTDMGVPAGNTKFPQEEYNFPLLCNLSRQPRAVNTF